MNSAKYQWPASALTPADMKMLHAVRESSPGTAITHLIARAVRCVYGPGEPPRNLPRKEQ